MRKAAVYTLVHNESVFLPLWIKYYHQFFSFDDMYILDHESSDGSTEKIPCNVIRVFNGYVHDDVFMNEVITRFQYKLLEQYEYFLYVDCDEFVYHKIGLDTYINSLTSPCIKPEGYEVIHMRKKEQPINLAQPILKQRNYWIRSSMYSKPILSRVPMYWITGRHDAANGGYVDSNLLLVHLKRFDYQLAKEKNIRTANENISPVNIKNSWGYQCWLIGKRFDDWFEGDFCTNYNNAKIDLIPKDIRNSIPL